MMKNIEKASPLYYNYILTSSFQTYSHSFIIVKLQFYLYKSVEKFKIKLNSKFYNYVNRVI